MSEERLREVMESIQEAVIAASTTFRPDQVRRYEQVLAQEEDERARWVLERILENARVAAEKKLPLCDDTGIPHLFLEIGEEAALPAGFFPALYQGVAEGLRALPGRPMAVKGNEEERLLQSAGLDPDSGALAPAPVQLRVVPGRAVRVTVLMLGGGPEIQGKTQRIFHKHSLAVILGEMIAWAREGALRLGCTPCVLAFGVGRTQVEAASLSLQALAEGDFDRQTPLEERITAAVNEAAIGPLGLGGRTTALGTFLQIGPQRASGVRVVSLRVGCCFDPRRATVTFASLPGEAGVLVRAAGAE